MSINTTLETALDQIDSIGNLAASFVKGTLDGSVQYNIAVIPFIGKPKDKLAEDIDACTEAAYHGLHYESGYRMGKFFGVLTGNLALIYGLMELVNSYAS